MGGLVDSQHLDVAMVRPHVGQGVERDNRLLRNLCLRLTDIPLSKQELPIEVADRGGVGMSVESRVCI